ncbi:helix-turn-helix domain-containing protein [Mucilaginibacter sp. PAMB04274]|uniref:MarR family winged helix-turn-helix transcriptional regulator n=1 Tax=Mucilaginibacter sp. PAMB04274 TaxID=3138568 RepID=UPI0031F655CB
MDDKDFLRKLSYAGLSSRIKRLSDALLYSTKDFYHSLGLDIEPNWHLVFLLLKENENLSLADIAERLQLSHPAIIKIVKAMQIKGYVQAKKDENDSRKQILFLTQKSYDALPGFERCWTACVLTMQEIAADNNDFLDALTKIEEKIKVSNYKDRTIKNLKA